MQKIESFLKDILSAFKATKGSWSMKRVLSFFTAIVVFYVVIHCAVNEKQVPNESILALIGAYVTLAGADTFVSVFQKNKNNSNNTNEDGSTE